MGVHNRITAEKYKQLKAELHSPVDDDIAIAKYGLSRTTCRMVRNTANYAEYCERRFRYHGNPQARYAARSTVRSQVGAVGIPKPKPEVVASNKAENAVEREMREASATIRTLLFLMVIIMAVLITLLVWRVQ